MSTTAPDGADAGRDANRASRGESASRPGVAFDRLGLCPRCRHVQRIESARGSTFLLCTLSRSDARFAKYPPQPLRACVGFEP